MKNTVATLQLKTENSATVAYLSFKTDLTIKHSAFILNELMEAEKKCDVLHITTTKDCLMDLSGFQILKALSTKARKKERPLHIELHLSQESEQLLHKAGLDTLLNN